MTSCRGSWVEISHGGQAAICCRLFDVEGFNSLSFLWVMLFLLALAVGVLPLIVKDDGSAAGMTQILITYTLSMITAIMGASTLWISAGSLANEIENHQLQMVVTKPIPRWQIWLGKWIGVMSMNFILLLFAGGDCVWHGRVPGK